MPKAVSHASTKPNIIKMYATPWCIDCYMAKRWFESHGIAYEYINILEDESAAEYVLRVICNKLVVLVLGFSGALTFFNPLRPFLGLASIILLSVTLLLRVRVLRHGCPVPLKEVATVQTSSFVAGEEEKERV